MTEQLQATLHQDYKDDKGMKSYPKMTLPAIIIASEFLYPPIMNTAWPSVSKDWKMKIPNLYL